MDGLLHDPARHAQLELLVMQQRYEESVSLLSSAIEADPNDRDACLYRLLVARIIVLRQVAESHELSVWPVAESKIICALAHSLKLLRRALSRSCAAVAVWWRSGHVKAVFTGLYVRLCRESHKTWYWISRGTIRSWQIGWAKHRALTPGREVRRLAWGMRAACLLSAISIISIITALCVIFLSRSSARSPVPREIDGPNAVLRNLPPTASSSEAHDLVDAANSKAGLASSAERNAPRLIAVEGSPAAIIPVESHNPQLQRGRSDSDVAKASDSIKKSSSRKAASEEIGNAQVGRPSPAKTTSRYIARHTITVREAPRYGAATLETFSAGASVSVLDISGSWAKILLADDQMGFVRVEFLDPPALPERP
jgi:hypothetical protein